MRSYNDVKSDMQTEPRKVTLYALVSSAAHSMYDPGAKPDVPRRKRELRQASLRLARAERWAASPTASHVTAAYNAYCRDKQNENDRATATLRPAVVRYQRWAARLEIICFPRGVPRELKETLLSDLKQYEFFNRIEELVLPTREEFIAQELEAARRGVAEATSELEATKARLKEWQRNMRHYRRIMAAVTSMRAEIGRTRA